MEEQLARDLQEIKVRLSRIDERMQAHALWHDRDSNEAMDRETRIRSLERWKYALPASVILAVGSIVTALVT